MNEVNKTLYIPFYGKAYVTEKGFILQDPKAQEIWQAEGFPLKGKSRSKWLAYYMGMRAAVFDRWTEDRVKAMPNAAVIHIGCGMDSRCLRTGHGETVWYDVDFPDVIRERRRYYQETDRYKMVCGDVRESDWLSQIDGNTAIVVMEGVSMYLKPEELCRAVKQLCGRFEKLALLMDCYSTFAAKASKYKNPINDVGVTQVYGLDDPKLLEEAGVRFVRELDMTPKMLIGQLSGLEKKIFEKLYAGSMAGKMYRLYEFHKGETDVR